MGKNSGKKARARFNPPSIFRPAKEEGELYAMIEKNMGNGVLNVRCIDGMNRLCIVRKKFAGRERSSLTLGTWILVGLREFETKKDRCDLIEIYSQADVGRLLKMDGPWHLFTEVDKDVEFVETVYIPDSAPITLELAEINIDEI